ncbi:hypothetical protein MZM54_04715 [[Brevibacterium] frigoritolerans]|nr:hypothetical protein [Peribacillus frigoritolerans]
MKNHILFVFCSLIILSGCSSNFEGTSKTIIKNEIEHYYENLLLEDLDAVMKQISTDSKQYYDLYDEYRDTFQKFDYSYNVKEISFNEVSNERIILSTSLTISGVNETDEFDSFDVVQIFTLKPIKDKVWKISSLETKYDFQ